MTLSDLLYQPFGADDAVTIDELSPLSQGLNVIGDQLYVTSEATATSSTCPDALVAIDVFDIRDFGLDPRRRIPRAAWRRRRRTWGDA